MYSIHFNWVGTDVDDYRAGAAAVRAVLAAAAGAVGPAGRHAAPAGWRWQRGRRLRAAQRPSQSTHRGKYLFIFTFTRNEVTELSLKLFGCWHTKLQWNASKVPSWEIRGLWWQMFVDSINTSYLRDGVIDALFKRSKKVLTSVNV